MIAVLLHLLNKTTEEAGAYTSGFAYVYEYPVIPF